MGGEVYAQSRALAERSGYPLLAEATSGARFGAEGDCVDLVLRSKRFRAAHTPTLLIELGMPATSASYGAWCAEHANAARWVISPHGWPDPQGGCAARVFAGDALIQAVLARLGARGETVWRRDFAEADAAARERVRGELDDGALHELNIAADLAGAMRDGDALMVGNSMPVRDLDVFASTQARVAVHHQRGASGIDGTVAGAAGLRAAMRPTAASASGDASGRPSSARWRTTRPKRSVWSMVCGAAQS